MIRTLDTLRPDEAYALGWSDRETALQRATMLDGALAAEAHGRALAAILDRIEAVEPLPHLPVGERVFDLERAR